MKLPFLLLLGLFANASLAQVQSPPPDGRARDAIDSLQKALAASQTPETKIACYEQLARCQQQASDAEGALKTWRQLSQEFPADTAALDAAGDAMTDASRYADAQSFYEAARDAKGAAADQKARAIFKLAQLAQIQHSDETARALYESALQIVPADGWMAREARHRIEDSFRGAEDIPGLAASDEAWLKTHDHDADAVLRLSRVLSELDRKPEAIAWLRKAADWAPARKEIKIALAELLLDSAEPQAAVAIFQELAMADGAQPADAERLAGAQWQLFETTGDEQAKRAAIKGWKRLVSASETDPQRVLHVAEIFRAHGMPENALPFYERAAILAPDAPQYWERWADYLTDLKRDAEARKVLHALVEGPRAKASDFLLLARLWRARNENDAALQTVRAALDLDPENFDLLSFQWTLLAAANRWPDAARLAERLIDSAPSLASAEQVEDNHAQALRKFGALKDTLQKYAQRLTNGPPPSETELRLLVGLALRDGNMDLAGNGLEAAARLFPNSAALVYDRSEYERRKGHLERSVAALQHLAELQPEQKTVWLRQITHIYQDESLWEKATAAAQRLIGADPANPDALALAADVDLAAGHFDAGVARLGEAIRLSKKPNALRVKLAEAFLNAGQFDAARDAFEIAFAKETDPDARFSLSGKLADACARSGRLDELIARFRERRDAEKDGWRYSLYLSEIFRRENDFPAARQELIQALGPRSRDATFLTQSARISIGEHDTAERALVTRLLAEAGPGDARQIELVFALSANGEPEAALKAAEANQEALFQDPMKWHDALAQLAAAGAGRGLASILQAGLARHADDWRLRLLLAEADLHNGDFDAADKMLHEIESLPSEAASLPPSTLPDAANRSSSATPFSGFSQASGITYASGFFGAAGADFTRRILRGSNVRQNLAQIAAGLEGSPALGFTQFTSLDVGPFFNGAETPKTLAEAADAALIIHSILAQRQGRGPAFLTALESKLKVQSRSERIAVLTLVQALDPLMNEIAEEAAHPSADAMLNAVCLEVLMTLANQSVPGDGSVDVDLARLIPALQTFLQRERRPGALFAGGRSLSKALLRAGRAKEAQKATDDLLTYWYAAPRSQDFDMFNFAMENGALETAWDILSHIAFDARNKAPSVHESEVGSLQTNLAKAILTKNRADSRAVFLLTSALRISYGTGSPILYNSQAFRMRSIWNQQRVFLDGNRYIVSPYQIMAWSEIFNLAKGGGLLAYIKPSLKGPSLDLPSAQSAQAKLARICFLWWDNKKDDAIREIDALADADKSDELHLMAASMLAEQRRREEAQKALDQVSATSGDLGITKLVRMLELARAANDTARAKQIATQLADVPLPSNDQLRLQDILNQLGLAEKAAELAARIRARGPSFPGSQANRLALQLQQETQAKHETEALSLARLILSRPAPEPYSIEDIARQNAIASLKQLKALPAYSAELEQDLKKSPNSVRTLFLLAEASLREQPEESIDYYRRLVQLEPGNTGYQSRLAVVLSNNGQREEAMRIWEMLLARKPESILGNHFFAVVTGYQNAGQMSRLGDALLRAQSHVNPLADLAFTAHDTSDDVLQVAADLRRSGNTEDAIRLWRAALERMRLQSKAGLYETGAVKSLVSALLELGRKTEAATELEHYFLPASKPKSALGFDIRPGTRRWMSETYASGGRSELQGVPLMRLARQAGALDQLRAKAVAAAASHPQDHENLLLLLIDVIQRDPAKFCSLKTEFYDALQAARQSQNRIAASTLFLLARTLGDWPEARPLALSIEENSLDPFESTNEGKNLQLAELAAQLGEQKIARQTLREWSSETDRAQSIFDLQDSPQQLSAADLMSRVGMETEAGVILRKTQAGHLRNSPDIARQIDGLSSRLALLAGEPGHAQITVWAAPPAATPQKITIFWEIGAAPGEPVRPVLPVRPVRPLPSSGEQPPVVSGEDLPQLDGRFTVELFRGPTPSALEPLATIPAAKMRGAWESPEPLTQGYVVAILREKGAVAYTQETFVPGAANQVENPDLEPAGLQKQPGANALGIPGWPGLLAADIERLPGGPNPGGRYVRLGLLQDISRSTIPLQRIPLEPGRTYYFTSWLRAAGDGARAGLSGQFLDKDGKPIGQASSSFTTISGRWVSCAMRLTAAHATHATHAAPFGSGTTSIPRQAAFFEPQIVTGGSQCEISGLYFGEVSPDPVPAK